MKPAGIRKCDEPVPTYEINFRCEDHSYNEKSVSTEPPKCPKCAKGIMRLAVRRENIRKKRLECSECEYAGTMDEAIAASYPPKCHQCHGPMKPVAREITDENRHDNPPRKWQCDECRAWRTFD